ncbi:MAG: DegV family protein [Hungatella hathewayi]|nr:DegV family protein [Hungatella hathewayi]
MSYKIIGDSCLDLTEELKKDSHFQMIPLTLQVDDMQVIDDETFDQKKFLAMVKASPNCPKTACPSPEMFKEAYECDAENIFVITLSSNLSGTYNSAVLAKGLYEEEHGKKNIAVIDSWSASSGELNIGLMIRDLCEQGMPFEEVVEKVTQYTQHEMKTYFVLESLDTLRKNGRLSGLQAFFATTLNIKPVMGADKGNIIKLDQARGINKALVRMCELAVKEAKNPETLRVIVAHCNNEARAQLVKEELSRRAPFKEILVTETAGVATVYASDGGIILAL